MNTFFKRAIAAILVFSALTVSAQNKIYDVITLKNDMGVIKGYINEQIFGDNPSMVITPVEAFLTIKVENIEGGRPSTTVIDGKTYDMFTLKKGGEEIVGNIVSESLDKWYKVNTTMLSKRAYFYSEISKLGKELINPKDSFYEAYGMFESITLKSGIKITGIVVEQELGVSVTMRDRKDNLDKIIDVNNIYKIDKEPYSTDKNIFEQCATIDIVQTSSDNVKGVIISQILGKSVTLSLPDDGGYSSPISYAQITSIKREDNKQTQKSKKSSTNKEAAPVAVAAVIPTTTTAPAKVVAEPKIVEPVNVGLYTFIDNSNKYLESYSYRLSNDARFIVLEGAQMSLSSILKVGSSYSFVISLDDFAEDILPSFQVWSLSTNFDRQTKYIEIEPKKKKKNRDEDTEIGVSISCEEYGNNSILIKLTPSIAGEYAITHIDCATIAVFKAE